MVLCRYFTWSECRVQSAPLQRTMQSARCSLQGAACQRHCAKPCAKAAIKVRRQCTFRLQRRCSITTMHVFELNQIHPDGLHSMVARRGLVHTLGARGLCAECIPRTQRTQVQRHCADAWCRDLVQRPRAQTLCKNRVQRQCTKTVFKALLQHTLGAATRLFCRLMRRCSRIFIALPAAGGRRFISAVNCLFGECLFNK